MKLRTARKHCIWLFVFGFIFVTLCRPLQAQDGQFNESAGLEEEKSFTYHEPASDEETHFVSVNPTSQLNNSGHWSQPCTGLTDPKIYQCLNDLKEDLKDYIYTDCTTCRVHCCVSLKFYHCIRNVDTCGLEFSSHFLAKLFNFKFVFYSENSCGAFKYPSVRCFFYLHETAIVVTLFTFIMVSFAIILVVTLYYKFWQIQKVFGPPNRQGIQSTNDSSSTVTVRLPPTPPPPYSQVKNQMQFPPPPTYEEAQTTCTNNAIQQVSLSDKV